MKILNLITVFTFFTVLAFSQDIKMTTELVEDDELFDILYFENIDYYKITFTGKALVGKDYTLISKEIWNGVITQTDTIVNSSNSERIKKIAKDTFRFKVISKKTNDNFLKMNFSFPHLRTSRKYRAINSEDYSLRDIGIGEKIKAREKFYALAYILPYETPNGWKMWCDVESSGNDIETWGEEFGIEHYVIFEMSFD